MSPFPLISKQRECGYIRQPAGLETECMLELFGEMLQLRIQACTVILQEQKQ